MGRWLVHGAGGGAVLTGLRDADGEVWLEGGVSRGGRRLFAGLEPGLVPSFTLHG